MIEYKEEEGDWVTFVLAPSWPELKILADKWDLAIREIDDFGFISREYYPSKLLKK